MTSTGAVRAKLIAGICIILILVLAGWEASRLLMPKPAVQSVPPVAVQPSPIPSEARPAPPLETAKKPLMPPAHRPKKPAAVKKPAHRTPAPSRPPPSVPKPSVSAPVPPPLALPPLPPEPMEWHGNDTSVTHVGQVVIHNDRQWIQFWSEHHPDEAAPDVDFSKNMVVGVFAGPRPAEQFTIKMVNFQLLPGSLVISYRERLPPPGTFAVNVTVYPYELKVIPRSTLPVKFTALEPENVAR